MLRSLFTAATGMDAQQLQMDVIANNLANTSTVGFKKGRPEFEDLISEKLHGAAAPDPRGGTTPSPLEVGLGVRTASTTRSFTQGDMLQTDNQLDVAIQGQGFFRVQLPSGEYSYTRAGNFRVDANGRVVTQNGEILQPEISVPSQTTSITVGSDGTVTAVVSGKTDAQTLGTLQLYTFPNPGGLEAAGNNLLNATVGSGDAVGSKPGEQGAGTLSQGYLENSNVQAVQEMINMIATQRGYELNSKVIQTADQMLQRLTSLR